MTEITQSFKLHKRPPTPPDPTALDLCFHATGNTNG